MTQKGLIEQILRYVVIKNESKAHSTPKFSEQLLANEGASPFEAKWSYRSLVGKLSYLAKKNKTRYRVYRAPMCTLSIKPKQNTRKRNETYLLLSFKNKGSRYYVYTNR